MYCGMMQNGTNGTDIYSCHLESALKFREGFTSCASDCAVPTVCTNRILLYSL